MSVTVKRVLFLVGLGLGVLLLWRFFGREWAGGYAGTSLALAAARKRRASRSVPLPDYPAEDAKVDARRTEAAAGAGKAAADTAGKGWAETPARDRPKLRRMILPFLLPALLPRDVQAEPVVRTPLCVPVATYGAHAAKAGYGLWEEDGVALWCRCPPLDVYGETTRIPAGCEVAKPVIAYTLEAHIGTSRDIAEAQGLIDGLKFDLKDARKERTFLADIVNDAQAEADLAIQREGELIALLAAQEQKTLNAEEDATAWLTWRSVVLGVGAFASASYGTYRVCTWKGC